MIATTLNECLICGPILEDIAAATTIGELDTIRRLHIRHAIGITHEDREALIDAVHAREREIAEFHLGRKL